MTILSDFIREVLNSEGYLRDTILLIPFYLVFLIIAWILTPIHETTHILACNLVGLEVGAVNIMGEVSCKGIGKSVVKGGIVYNAPYALGLFYLGLFYWVDRNFQIKKSIRNLLIGYEQVVYTDSIANIFVFPLAGYLLDNPDFAKTDIVTMSSVFGIPPALLSYTVLITLLGLLWYIHGKENAIGLMEDFLEKVVD